MNDGNKSLKVSNLELMLPSLMVSAMPDASNSSSGSVEMFTTTLDNPAPSSVEMSDGPLTSPTPSNLQVCDCSCMTAWYVVQSIKSMNEVRNETRSSCSKLN